MIPGNGCDTGTDTLDDCMWYGWLAEQLRQPPFNMDVASLPTFPDPLYAREPTWKGFVRGTLALDENTLVIGHSSGAACAMRLLEDQAPMAACMIVSGYDSDMGDAIERESGYFSRPFDYNRMRGLCDGVKAPGTAEWVLQLHSHDDHLVDVNCARRVAAGFENVKSGAACPYEYVELQGWGHFQDDEVPPMVDALRRIGGF